MAEQEVEIEQFMRIAIRKEGNMINAYLAPPQSMEGAKLVAMINRHFVNTDESFKAWREILQNGFRKAVKGALGLDIKEFITESAPEHERSGHG